MRSLITPLVSGVDIGGGTAPGVVGSNPNARPGDTATSLYPQRLQYNVGVVQITFNQDPDPGGGSTGLIKIEGRLHADSGWVLTYSFDISTADGNSAYTTLITDIPMLHEMRVNVTDDASTYSVAAGTEVEVAIQE